MTNNEAIRTLKANYPDACFEQLREAVDVAINALTKEAWKEEHPVSPLLQKLATNLQPSKQDDLISRQAAIDAILAVTGNSSVRELYEHVQEHELSDMWSGGVNAAIDIIIAVPPVHPEPCEDTISRKAAIDAIEEYADRLQIVDWKENPGVPYKAYALNWCINTIRDLPSAQSERKSGKWVRYDGDWLKTMCTCSECGAMIDINEKYRNFFCYHCGARMDGEIEAWNRRGMNG